MPGTPCVPYRGREHHTRHIKDTGDRAAGFRDAGFIIDRKKTSAYLVRVARIGTRGGYGGWFLVSAIGRLVDRVGGAGDECGRERIVAGRS